MTHLLEWDGESYCTAANCNAPALHQITVGMSGDDMVTELVCCSHVRIDSSVNDVFLQRLRNVAFAVSIDEQQSLGNKAADVIQRLLTAGDAMIEVLRSGSDWNWDRAIDSWEEARRG